MNIFWIRVKQDIFIKGEILPKSAITKKRMLNLGKNFFLVFYWDSIALTWYFRKNWFVNKALIWVPWIKETLNTKCWHVWSESWGNLPQALWERGLLLKVGFSAFGQWRPQSTPALFAFSGSLACFVIVCNLFVWLYLMLSCSSWDLHCVMHS